MNSRTKQITTVIVSLLIVLMLFAIFVLFFNDSQVERVEYIVDENNTCSWEAGVITSEQTEAAESVSKIEVDLANEEAYLVQAATDSTCTVKVGDMRGSYASKLNQIYESEQ